MSDNPVTPDWWQASDGKWYPPQAAPDLMNLPPPPGQQPKASNVKTIMILAGIVLMLIGAAAAFALLNQQVGPGGLCGSMFNRLDGGGAGPCWNELRSQATTAAVVGGALGLGGLVLLGFGLTRKSQDVHPASPPNSTEGSRNTFARAAGRSVGRLQRRQ